MTLHPTTPWARFTKYLTTILRLKLRSTYDGRLIYKASSGIPALVVAVGRAAVVLVYIADIVVLNVRISYFFYINWITVVSGSLSFT